MVLDTARSRGLFDYKPSNRRYYPTGEAYRFKRSTPAELTKAELIEAKRWHDLNISLAIEIADRQGWVSVRLLTNMRNFDLRKQQDAKPARPFLTDVEAQEVLKEACAGGVLRETGPDRYELLEGESFIEANARRQANWT